MNKGFTGHSGFTANDGFTLLEVMVALVILTFLAFFTSQSIQNALKAKGRLEKVTDRNSTLRDALKIIERDVNNAFNYRNVTIELYNQTQEARKKGKAGVGTTQPTPPGGIVNPGQTLVPPDPNVQDKYPLKIDKVLTQFMGEKNSLNFSTLSNIRMSEDAQMDTQAEIGYSLKPCRRRSTQEQSSQCLWRRVANYIDEDIDKGGTETVLLENVDKFELRYLGPGKEDEWLDTWISGERADALTKNKFPYAVEITLSINDPANRSAAPLKMVSVAAIRNPNNPEEPDAAKKTP
jgi:prepilin-type N-terminal cleavage/methylation domain-containing protein